MEEKFIKLIKEFIKIITFVLQNDKYFLITNGNVAIERNLLLKLLSKHNYLRTHEKLKFWKVFNFIKTDRNRFTIKRVIEKDGDKSRLRLVVININSYKKLKKYFPNNVI